MMGHLLPQELLIMAISPLVPSRTWSVDMPHKQAITSQEDLAGTVMGSLLSTKLIKRLKSPISVKSLKWESPNTIKNAVISLWNTPVSGKALSAGLEGGSISKMIIKPLISSLWNLSGTFLSSFLRKVLCTEEGKSCLIQTLVQLYCLTLKFNLIIKKSATLRCMLVSHLLRIPMLSLWYGQQLPGLCHPI